MAVIRRDYLEAMPYWGEAYEKQKVAESKAEGELLAERRKEQYGAEKEKRQHRYRMGERIAGIKATQRSKIAELGAKFKEDVERKKLGVFAKGGQQPAERYGYATPEEVPGEQQGLTLGGLRQDPRSGKWVGTYKPRTLEKLTPEAQMLRESERSKMRREQMKFGQEYRKKKLAATHPSPWNKLGAAIKGRIFGRPQANPAQVMPTGRTVGTEKSLGRVGKYEIVG